MHHLHAFVRALTSSGVEVFKFFFTYYLGEMISFLRKKKSEKRFMATICEILEFKGIKGSFGQLYHSERARIIQQYGNMNYEVAYKMNAQEQSKLLFQLLYTSPNPAEIRKKVEMFLEIKKNK